MASVELELQGAVVARLKADAALSALVGSRIYDAPPSPVVFPYVTQGEAQTIRADITCLSGSEIYLTIHAWSQAEGYPEVKRIADAVVEALHMAPLLLATNRLISLMHQNTRTFRDQDDVTNHSVIEFVARTEKPLA